MATVKTRIGNVKGKPGDPGKSAYRYAVDGGYTGTESEFTAKLAKEHADAAHKHTKSDISDFPTSMIPTAHKHTKSDISDFPTSMTPTAHNQAASTITAGTFGGQVVANASGQAAGTSLLRNSKLVSADTNPTVNGEIAWTYK